MRKESIIIVAAALILLPLSCKKDDTTETKPSLTGIKISSAPAYVAKDQNVSLTIDVSGVASSSSDKTPGTMGLYYRINSGDQLTITEDISGQSKYDVTVPVSELGSYTVLCCVYDIAGEFYSASATATFKAIDPSESMSGDLPSKQSGEKYAQFVSGGLTWMAENLYETSSGQSYDDCPVMDSIFGRYYSHEEALTACPSGWRLPTAAEFDALGSDAGALMANASFLSSEFWPYNTKVDVTNATGFSALAVGYIDNSKIDALVTGEHEYAMFWTADTDGTKASFRYLFAMDPAVGKGEGSPKSLALSVRCVK